MIYCGSGSYFGKVLDRVPAPVPVPVLDPDLFSTVFQQRKNCTKCCFFNSRSSLVVQKVGLYYNCGFFYFYITFYVRSGSKTRSGNGMHYSCVSDSAKAKSCGSCGSGAGSGYTTLPKSIADEKILAHLRNLKEERYRNFYRRRIIIFTTSWNFEQLESK
jgi:hypothetical protein